MKNKEIYSRALKLAVPMMIQNGITNAVGLVDNLMVGSIGTEAITAVSIVGQLIFVFNLAIFGGLSAPGIYSAQFFGKGNIEGVRNTFRIKIWICTICLAAGIPLFVFAGRGLIGLYLSGESSGIDVNLTIDYALGYLRIMLLGFVPFAITQIYAGTMRETGSAVAPMTAGICSVVTDIIFNYLFIYGNFGFPRLGVRGAAVATVIARVVEMGVIVIWAHTHKHKHEFLQGVYRTLLVPKAVAMKIVYKGLPIFFNEFLWAGGIAAQTQCYSTRGLSIIAGMNISNVLCNLLNVVFIALGNSVGIIIGQTLGASQYEKAKKDSFSLMWFTGIICAGLTVLLVAASGAFPMLYKTTEEVRRYAQSFIVITALFFPVQGFLNALYFTLRSGGKTVVTFLFDSVYSWVVIVPTAFILSRMTSLPVLGVYAAVQSADIIKVIIGYVLIKKGIWISNLAKEAEQLTDTAQRPQD